MECPKCSVNGISFTLLPDRQWGVYFCANCLRKYNQRGEEIEADPVRFDWKPGKDKIIAHALGVKLDEDMPEVHHGK